MIKIGCFSLHLEAFCKQFILFRWAKETQSSVFLAEGYQKAPGVERQRQSDAISFEGACPLLGIHGSHTCACPLLLTDP